MPDPVCPPASTDAIPAGRCTRCGSRPAAQPTARDGVVCAACAAAYYTCCSCCEEWHRDNTPCPDCVTCDRCEDMVPRTWTLTTIGGSRICGDCRRAFYWQCSCCDGWNRDGDICGNGCQDGDGCDCADCHRKLLHDYYYKPAPIFHGTGPLFLGCELEIETPYARTEECIELAALHLGTLGYLKEDGSLHNGFEIVTHPMSYPWALAHFPWAMLTDLYDSGATVTDDTGLHIHLSRTGFDSPCHIYRWMKLIYRNQRQVETLARRRASSWAAFTDTDRRAITRYAKGAAGDRYGAVNPNNRNTFELRVFASTLQPPEVRAALAFAAASVHYTRALSVPAIAVQGGWTWPAFVAWLRDHPTYTPLLDHLETLPCVC